MTAGDVKVGVRILFDRERYAHVALREGPATRQQRFLLGLAQESTDQKGGDVSPFSSDVLNRYRLGCLAPALPCARLPNFHDNRDSRPQKRPWRPLPGTFSE